MRVRDAHALLADEFFYAEDYHPQYLAANPRGYCNYGLCQVASA